MPVEDTLQRFFDAQNQAYARALAEVKNGRKQSHWMWYIFPQIAGLGYSETAQFYALKDLTQAQAYFDHPLLGSRLIEISQALLAVEGKTANQLMGSPDDLKLRSSMTLFSLLEKTDPVFQAVLAKYYQGSANSRTVALIQEGQ